MSGGNGRKNSSVRAGGIHYVEVIVRCKIEILADDRYDEKARNRQGQVDRSEQTNMPCEFPG